MSITIVTPRGTIVSQKTKSGTVTTTLTWDIGFGPRMSNTFNRVQAYVDNEVLRFCTARVPFKSGMLQKSGILGTSIGSGTVRYLAPYASYQYRRTKETRPYDANRGAHWFERGKATERKRILQGASRIIAQR